MAKKKNSMALFEVISKSRDKHPESEVLVPEWMKPGHTPPPAPAKTPPPAPEKQSQPPRPEPVEPVAQPSAVAEPEPVEPEPVEPIIPEPETPEPSDQTPDITEVDDYTPRQEPIASKTGAARRQRTDQDQNAAPPIWRTDGERLTLSLNYVSCMVASMGILLLIIVAFVLGRATAPSQEPLVPTNQNAVKRIAGKYYMVIQRFAGNGTHVHAEAKRAAEFCTANGEPATVELLPKVVNGKIVAGQGDLIVWSGKAFNSHQGEEVRAHALFVQNELGAKYAGKYGTQYRFGQTSANRKLAPVMYPYKKHR